MDAIDQAAHDVSEHLASSLVRSFDVLAASIDRRRGEPDAAAADLAEGLVDFERSLAAALRLVSAGGSTL